KYGRPLRYQRTRTRSVASRFAYEKMTVTARFCRLALRRPPLRAAARGIAAPFGGAAARKPSMWMRTGPARTGVVGAGGVTGGEVTGGAGGVIGCGAGAGARGSGAGGGANAACSTPAIQPATTPTSVHAPGASMASQ